MNYLLYPVTVSNALSNPVSFTFSMLKPQYCSLGCLLFSFDYTALSDVRANWSRITDSISVLINIFE